MSFDDLRKFLEAVRNSSSQPEMVAMLSDYEDYIVLEKEKLGGFKDPEEYSRFLPHYLVAQLKLQHSLEKFCAVCNTTPEALKQCMQNPNNFSVEEWQHLQEVKRETAAEFEIKK